MVEGNPGNLISFNWNPEYEDLTNRFEGWVGAEELDKIKTAQDLYDKLDKWMPKHQPKPKQMDLFTEYYKLPYFQIKEDAYVWFFELKTGAYNRDTSKFGSFKTGKEHEVEERVYHMKYGDRLVLVDKKKKFVLAHLKDLKTDEFLSAKYE